MYSASRAPINPAPRPERERAKVYQLEAIAYMAVSGTSPGKMAEITGLSESYIARLLSGKQNTTFNKLLEDHNQKKFENVVGPI
jgi:hypothetical protein